MADRIALSPAESIYERPLLAQAVIQAKEVR